MVQNIGDPQANTVILAGQAVDRSTVQGLKSASAKSGVSFQYLLAKASQESSLNPNAQAETSSAAGLFQFTRSTWLTMFKRYGSQYGYADLSRQILETPSGKLTVTDDDAEKRILALRNDPEVSGLMAAQYARDNSTALESALGHQPDATDLYLAHFLGANGATSLLTAPQDSNATTVLPAAAKANPSVFTTPDGQPRTAGQVLALVRSRFTSQLARYADAGTTATDANPVSAAAPAAAAGGTATSAAPTNTFNLQSALSGTAVSPTQMMLLDQLLHMIADDPMTPSDDDHRNDPFKPLSSGALKGSDWADAMSRKLVPAVPNAPAARRAYKEPGPGPQNLDDQI